MKEIDFDAMKKHLHNRKFRTHFISSKNKITDKCIQELKYLVTEYKSAEVLGCFSPSDGSFYNLEISCSGCNVLQLIPITKTKFTDMFSSKNLYKNPLCESCKEIEKNKLKEKKIQEEDDRHTDMLVNTINYIDNYLNPKNSWTEGTKLWEKWNYINVSHGYEWNYIKSHIRSMDYKEFLKTPYWKAVALKKKHQCDYKCQLCNSKENLQTHHRTYDIKGEEIFNMKDLTVLCDACHAKHHDK